MLVWSCVSWNCVTSGSVRITNFTPVILHSVLSPNFLVLSFIHPAAGLTKGPWPLPNTVHHTVRSSASPFNLQCPLFALRSSSSSVRFLPRLPVTSILPPIFISITCFRRLFLRKTWPIKLAFLLFTVYTTFLSSLTLRNTTSFLTWSAQLIFSILVPVQNVNINPISNTYTSTILDLSRSLI